MKVFISWSGAPSQNVAIAFREFLREALASKVQPFVSSEDIGKGARGLNVIAKELEDAMFGVVVVTQENIGSMWVNFEAGALSRIVDQNYVAPLLVGIADAEIVGPLKQFQNTNAFDHSAVLQLVKNINARLDDPLPDKSVATLFDSAWPALGAIVDAAATATPPEPADARQPAQVLEEVLTTVRGLQRTVDRIEATALHSPRRARENPVLEDAQRMLRLALEREGITLSNFSVVGRKQIRVGIPDVKTLPDDAVRRISVVSEITEVEFTVHFGDQLLQFIDGSVERLVRVGSVTVPVEVTPEGGVIAAGE